MMRIVFIVGAPLALSIAASGAGASEAVDAQAQRLLQGMSDYLASAQEFSFHAEVSDDSVQTTGEKLEFGGAVKVAVRRPDRLRVNYDGDDGRRRIFFDGNTLTMYDLEANLFADSAVPSNLDAAMDQVFEKFGLSVPIADLVYSDPYSTLMASVEGGSVIGTRAIDGVSCHHLSFVQEAIDWQIWIADGPAPLPRKLVITYKNEPGSPQYSARLHSWNLQARTADSYFRFEAPLGANEMQFLPSGEEP